MQNHTLTTISAALLGLSLAVPFSSLANTQEIHGAVVKNAETWRIPESIIKGVIQIESGFNPKARSPQNAIGLMQVVPKSGGRETWKFLYGEDHTPSKEILENPAANITLGTAYLAHIYYDIFSNIKNNAVRISLSLAAYNWGPGRVQKMIKRHGVPETVSATQALLSKHAPKETSDYVTNVLKKSIAFAKGEEPRGKVKNAAEKEPVIAANPRLTDNRIVVMR